MKERFGSAAKKTWSGLSSLVRKIPFGRLKQGIAKIPFKKLAEKGHRKWLLIIPSVILLIMFAIGWYWSREPGVRDPDKVVKKWASGQTVTGVYTTTMLIEAADTLLSKPGGYLSNDLAPPSTFQDNMPSWEFGVLVQVRDLARAMRNDISRSRSQSQENPALAKAEPLFNYDSDSWIFPASEDQYRKGIRAVQEYLDGLSKQNDPNTQFYARADNLRDWLSVVEKRLGSMSQRLSASVGEVRVNTDLAGDSSAVQSTTTGSNVVVKTPWLEIDNVFYEARGSTWALLHFFMAVRQDFRDILEKKNALPLVDQIIRELRATQRQVWSPIILNGSGFGLWTNHSLVMASYISRANAAVIDLRDLLSQG